MPNLTQYQEKALEHNRHISLTANAGSGKTFVLARRFLSILLEEDISLNNIVAITFTEKAASELYKKIADELESRISTSTSREEERKLVKLRRELVSAKISTIHSFCTEILKEFPTEAGIDANFIPIDQRTSDELIVAAIDETISSSLHNENSITKYVKNGIRLFGLLDSYRSILKKMIYERSLVSNLQNRLYDSGVEKSAKEFENIFSKYFNEIFSNQIQNVLAAVKLVNTRVKENDNNNETTISIETIITEIDFSTDIYTSIQKMIELFSLLLTGTGDVRSRKYLPKEKREGLHSSIELIENFYAEFKLLNFAEDYKKANLELAKFENELLNVWNDVLQNYNQKKSQKSYLDFEDLLLYTEVLVKRNDVLSYLSNRYSYFMIDEYQDTNETQFNIFIPILDYLKRGNLFIVGDEKQSIYMFRGADLQIFNKTKEIIRDANDDNSLLQLPHSFRLSSKLTLFTNNLFRKLFESPRLLFNEVPYSELICARGKSDEGEIAFLLSDGTEESDSEYQLVSKQIVELVAKRGNQFGNIAILSRKRKSFIELEKELLKRNIPYRIYGGKGFYQQQEIYDIYNYLLFLINTGNDEALIAILRSPFFMISDKELFAISKTNGENFWQRLINYSDNKSRFVKIVKQLQDDIQKSKSIEISLLIRSVLTTNGYYAKTRKKKNGNQIIANLDKLISTSITFMKKGSVTLFDFVSYLKELINKTEDESQATITDNENVVKLMTIHASKGLEFPIVFLIDTNSKGMGDQIKSKSISIDKSFGILTKLPLDNYFEEYSAAPIVGIYNIISEKKNMAERKRLLYVAVTRAENSLYISATAKRNKDGSMRITNDSFLQLFKNGLNIKNFEDPINISEDTLFMKEVDNQFVKYNELVNLEIPIISSIASEININYNEENKQLKEYKIYTESISDIPKEEIVSATKVSVYNQCPLKYHLIYDLGYTSLFYDGKENNDSIDFTKENIEESEAGIPANIKGSIIHKILEENTSTTDLDKRVSQLLETSFQSLSNKKEKNVKDEILKLVTNYYDSDIYKKLQSYKEYFNEYEIYLKLNDFYLYGIIDKVVVDKTDAIIIDYKTDSLQKYSAKEKLENYKYQLLFYAFLLKKINKNITTIKCMLVFIEDPNQKAEIDVSNDMLQKFEDEMLLGIKSMRIEKYNKKKSHCKSCYFSDSKNNCIVK